MEPWLIWVVAGFALIIAELLSGTFYLLVIGVAAFAGALMAYLGSGIFVQGVVASDPFQKSVIRPAAPVTTEAGQQR